MALTEKFTGKLTEALVLARTRAQDLESVRKLNCWASNIRDVSIVREMSNLEVCSLSVNMVSSLEHFAHCPNLQELYVRKNNIENLSDIHYLKHLPRLRSLWLADNPCATCDNYRLTVLRILPNLQKLDNVAVTEDEVNEALEEGDEVSPPELTASVTEPARVLTPLLVEAQEVNGAAGDAAVEERVEEDARQKQHEAVILSMEETNRIREQFGLKPVPIDKISTAKSMPTHATKARNTHILHATLLLVKELDQASLEILETAVRKRLESLV
ncbi:cilia- and flagella-associated protein 410-like [Gigantopelta aegis]|uniref:cilia- and flagella-associated protein 410-like n=1 Tax=Gigantopelta aegis TaxID=1735272 RepID=UPI001B88775B|nr:cilia- and flagella-associated protein 410-like [Gigantopelta aegis]